MKKTTIDLEQLENKKTEKIVYGNKEYFITLTAVKDHSSTKKTAMTKEELLEALRSPDHEKLKGSVLKDEDPFGSAVSESDWEVYS